MCLKLSILLRCFTVVTSLIVISFIEASLKSVKNDNGKQGCYYNHPHSAVCDYAVGLSVVTIALAIFFVLYDFIVGVKRRSGKKLKRVDIVLCVLLTLAWVACGGTMAGYDADMSSKYKDGFKDSERQYADAMVTVSWITCVSWILVIVTIGCSDGAPQEVRGLMAEPTAGDDDETKTLLSSTG